MARRGTTGFPASGFSPLGVGLLWTPPYWGFAGGVYGFHTGYWGPHVGFYGGVNYGFGYGGVGFGGGRWEGGHFAYNTAVNHVNVVNIHNTYVDRTVINNVNVNNHTSFNGGPRRYPGSSLPAGDGSRARESHRPDEHAAEPHCRPLMQIPRTSPKLMADTPKWPQSSVRALQPEPFPPAGLLELVPQTSSNASRTASPPVR